MALAGSLRTALVYSPSNGFISASLAIVAEAPDTAAEVLACPQSRSGEQRAYQQQEGGVLDEHLHYRPSHA